jgi:hypothetical protein
MKITAYNQHDVGSFSSLGRFRHYQSTRCNEPTSLCNQAKRRINALRLLQFEPLATLNACSDAFALN